MGLFGLLMFIIAIGGLLYYAVEAHITRAKTSSTVQECSSKEYRSSKLDEGGIKENVLSYMVNGGKYSFDGIMEEFKSSDLDTTREDVNSVLNKLCDEKSGELLCFEENGINYYCLKPQTDKVLSRMMPGMWYNTFTIKNVFRQFSRSAPEKYIENILPNLVKDGNLVEYSDDDNSTIYRLSKQEAETRCTAYQLEAGSIAQRIVANMVPGGYYSIGDMMRRFGFPDQDHVHLAQRIGYVLSNLGSKGTGQVERREKDGKAYFILTDLGEETRAAEKEIGDISIPQIDKDSVPCNPFGDDNEDEEAEVDISSYSKSNNETEPYSSYESNYNSSFQSASPQAKTVSHAVYTLDEARLRHDLMGYYGTAAFSGFPMASMDVYRVQRMNINELAQLAMQNGIDLNQYITDVEYK